MLNKITLNPSRPLICLEVNPPRGVSLDSIFERLDGNLEGIDFLNVTDCALARMKLAGLPFGSVLKQRYGLEPLVNFSCRDRNVIALQSDLLAAWMLGVRSPVALTGDAVSIGDMPDSKGVFEINSVGLLQLIRSLNSGRDLANNELKGKPEFFPGVVVNPNAKNTSVELKRLKRKAEAGACYALSQPVFDEEASVAFCKEAQAVGVPIFLGLLPLKSGASAHSVLSIPGIKISEKLLSVLDKAEEADLGDFFIEHCLKLAKLNKPYVCGFHVVSGANPKLALSLAQELVRARKEGGL